MLVLAAMFFGGDGGMETVVSRSLGNTVAVMWPQLQEGNQAAIVSMLTPVIPGGVGLVWTLVTVLNGALAQGLLVRMERNLRPPPSYSKLVLPDWISWFLVGAAALALVGSLAGFGQLEYLGRNLVIIFAMPFFLLGLAVAHAMVRRLPMAGMLLAVLYVVLVLSSGVLFVVAGVGLIEQWVGIRRRLTAPGKDQEDQ